jgi:hypothetical protein
MTNDRPVLPESLSPYPTSLSQTSHRKATGLNLRRSEPGVAPKNHYACTFISGMDMSISVNHTAVAVTEVGNEPAIKTMRAFEERPRSQRGARRGP